MKILKIEIHGRYKKVILDVKISRSGNLSLYLLKLYKAFILPHFYYCSSVWHFCGARNADKVDNLNNCILRFILLALVVQTLDSVTS